MIENYDIKTLGFKRKSDISILAAAENGKFTNFNSTLRLGKRMGICDNSYIALIKRPAFSPAARISMQIKTLIIIPKMKQGEEWDKYAKGSTNWFLDFLL